MRISCEELYGGGALLIRETVRRSGRGWPTMIVLALVYAIVEEAFVTQTLFNPNYLHLNLGLLKPAYIPALGIGRRAERSYIRRSASRWGWRAGGLQDAAECAVVYRHTPSAAHVTNQLAAKRAPTRHNV